ncbi:hypothetical protein MLC35_00680 [Sulfurimonas sp. NW7]|uniref:hypothetical protein n=1 Tax=Sulfurimonas sp. NW7 TaxID=2922727 RepID=UPI003DAA155C
MEFDDTFFLNPDEALRAARQQNKRDRYVLQVCYYDKESANFDQEQLPNLIPVSLNNLVDDLALGIHRLPESISFAGLHLSDEVKKEIVENFELSVRQAHIIREELKRYYLKNIKEAKPDFKEPLRFYLYASAYTQVMQYVSKNIADTLEDMGYEVLFDLDYGTLDVDCQKLLKEFNPHIIISINHMNNSFLGEEVFNFVWFQDSMPIITNDELIHTRKRDFVFALLPGVKDALYKKGVSSEIQNFCINTNLYKVDKSIEKKAKVVFIGGSYLENYMPYLSGSNAKDLGELAGIDTLIHEAVEIYKADGVFSEDIKYYLAQKYNKSYQLLNSYVIPFVIRDMTLLELCKMDIAYDIEVYGWGWEKYEIIKPYYKGVLNYGEDISKVYNGATYAIVAHPDYLVQQRTLEAAASGCIPLVYDCRYKELVTPPYYEDSLVFFQNLSELNDILRKTPVKKELSTIVDDHKYSSFAKKLIHIVEEKVQ